MPNTIPFSGMKGILKYKINLLGFYRVALSTKSTTNYVFGLALERTDNPTFC